MCAHFNTQWLKLCVKMIFLCFLYIYIYTLVSSFKELLVNILPLIIAYLSVSKLFLSSSISMRSLDPWSPCSCIFTWSSVLILPVVSLTTQAKMRSQLKSLLHDEAIRIGGKNMVMKWNIYILQCWTISSVLFIEQ